MRFLCAAAACLIAMFGAGPARAEVAAAGPGAFQIHAEAVVSAPPEQVWRSLIRVDRWWSPQHTYSGDARRLSLDPRAGGCWCERWGNGQSVEHARVVLVMERESVRTLRLVGGLGPLQQMGTTGVLTFTITPDRRGAAIDMSYRVSGEPGLALDQVAPLVDQVLMEQFARFVRYADRDAPE